MRQVALPLAWEMLLVRTNEKFPNFNCPLIASTYLGSKPIVASPKPAVAAQPATELQTGIYIYFFLILLIPRLLSMVAVSEVEIEVEVKELPPPGKIGIIIAGEVAKDEIKEAIVKALVVEGFSASDISISYVADKGILPYATLILSKSVNLVVASGVVVHDPKGFDYFLIF